MSATTPEPYGILLSNDLFFTSRVTSTALSLGFRLNVIGSLTQVISDTQLPGCVCLLLDLTAPCVNPEQIVSELPSDDRPLIIAFGPHVHTARLQAARAAGCDLVLPRSRFSTELPDLLRRAFEDH